MRAKPRVTSTNERGEHWAQVGPVHAQFDAGARFTARCPPSIPPPPPGVAPTPAQLAAMQGRQVVMGQKEGGIMNGSGSGGTTFW